MNECCLPHLLESQTVPGYLEIGKGGIFLNLWVQPGAARTELVGIHGDTLKIRVQAPPVDGAANEAVVHFFAQEFGLAKKQVMLEHGHSGRRKRLLILGIEPVQIQDWVKINSKIN